MSRNQLPEGVGKKIVEALKKQAENEMTPETVNTSINDQPGINRGYDINTELNSTGTDIMDENLMTFDSAVEGPVLFEVEEPEEIMPKNPNEDERLSIEPSIPGITAEEDDQAPIGEAESGAAPSAFEAAARQASLNIQQFGANAAAMREKNLANQEAKPQIKIPYNVAILNNLVATLPNGVTKQTGAHIIRQTLEAMGIPMNGVLKEAQEVQEKLNGSVRECMIKIQDYKTNIVQLEQFVHEYQRNINQLNDLISLFLLTDRD